MENKYIIHSMNDLENFVKEVEKKNSFDVGKAEECVESAIVKLREKQNNDDSEFEYEDSNIPDEKKCLEEYLDRIVDLYCLPEMKILGGADLIHNLSVSYARFGLMNQACDILNVGIQRYKMNADLLADYIKYGTVCGNYSKCEDYIEQLQCIPRPLWTWRAYSFQIDYLLDKFDRFEGADEFEKVKQKAIDLADEYIQWCHNELRFLDQACFDKASIYRKLSMSEQEKETLQIACQRGKAPKCTFQLANIEFDNKNYSTAVAFFKICKVIEAVEQGIDKGYLYLVSALSKAALFLENQQSTEKVSDKTEEYVKQVKDIYEDANIAKKLLNTCRLVDRVNALIFIMEMQTKIKNVDRDEAMDY